MSSDQSLLAGGDLYMDGVFRSGEYSLEPDGDAAERGYVASLRRAAKDVLYMSVEARSANLAYNESAAAEGRPLIERPIKREGVNYLGTALGIADAVALIGVVAWGHRALERRRARRAGSDGPFGGGLFEGREINVLSGFSS